MVQSADESQAKQLSNEPKAPDFDSVDSQTPSPKTAAASTKLLWLALIIVLACCLASSYWLLQQLTLQQSNLESLAGDAKMLKRENIELQQEFSQGLNQFASIQAENQKQFGEFVDTVESKLAAQSLRLAQMTSNHRIQYLLSEAQFLLRQANQRLHLEKSPTNAIALFKLADETLARAATELGNPTGLLTARQQLAQDLNTLYQLDSVDYTGLYFAIEGVVHQINTLALALPPREFANEEVEPAVIRKNPNSLWSRITVGWRNFTRQLGSYVRVRRLEEPVEPLLAPDQELRVRENLKLKLQVAQLAVMRADTDLYRRNLQLVNEWMLEYFPVSDARNDLIEQLQLLSEKTIEAQLPEVSASARALDTYINEYRQELGVAQ